MSWMRISGLLLRHWYVNKRTVIRLADVVVWPVAELVLWGFLSVYLSQSGDFPRFVGFFLGALILWDILFRANNSVTVGFLEEFWSKNLLNIFASPVTQAEYVTSLIIGSFLRVLVGGLLLAAIAAVFYGFNLFTIGLPLAAFFVNLLLLGWSIGIIVVAIILRFGQSAEVLAWAFIIFFQPFSAVFYPVSILPPLGQTIAKFVPSSHVFEGMRHVISTGEFSVHNFLAALGLNAVYVIIAIVCFAFVFHNARKNGRLVRSWQ